MYIGDDSEEKHITLNDISLELRLHNSVPNLESNKNNIKITQMEADVNRVKNISLPDQNIKNRDIQNYKPIPKIEDISFDYITYIEKVQNPDLVTCPVCEIEISEEEQEEMKIECNHLFCKDCYLNYLQEELINQRKIELRCMESTCTKTFKNEELEELISKIDKSLLSKYKRNKQRIEIINNPNKKFCPFPNCESFLELKDPLKKFVECEFHHKFCFDCLKPWHDKSKCEISPDKDFKEWKEGKLVKKCPQCGLYTEKSDGCNHMKCPACHHQWCFLCSGAYTDDHYQVGKCAYLQYSNNNIFHYTIIRVLYKLGIFLLMFFWFDIACAAYSAYRIFELFFNNNRYYIMWESPYRLMLLLMVGLYVISFQIFYMGIIFIIEIPTLFYWPLLNTEKEFHTHLINRFYHF